MSPPKKKQRTDAPSPPPRTAKEARDGVHGDAPLRDEAGSEVGTVEEEEEATRSKDQAENMREGKAPDLVLGLPDDLDLRPDAFACRVSEVPGRGLGLVATRPIRKGELLFRERSLVSPGYAQAVPIVPLSEAAATDEERALAAALPAPARVSFASKVYCCRGVTAALEGACTAAQLRAAIGLYDQFEAGVGRKTLAGVFWTNSMLNPENPSENLLCPVASRMNHSCRPNVAWFWAEPFVEVLAHRAIQPGEELSITYCELRAPWAERQGELACRYGFECRCEVCALPPQRRADSDRRRCELLSLDAAIEESEWQAPPPASAATAGLALAEKAGALMEDEGLAFAEWVHRQSWAAFRYAAVLGRERESRRWAERAHAAVLHLPSAVQEQWGSVLAQYMANPRLHPWYGSEADGP